VNLANRKEKEWRRRKDRNNLVHMQKTKLDHRGNIYYNRHTQTYILEYANAQKHGNTT
jgi:hypothetical protein